jgi:hypothetical protein
VTDHARGHRAGTGLEKRPIAAGRLRAPGAHDVAARVVDISLGGAGVVVSVPVPLGSRVFMDVATGGHGAPAFDLHLEARVRNIRNIDDRTFRLGLEFTANEQPCPLSGKEARDVEDLVEHLERRGALRADVWVR